MKSRLKLTIIILFATLFSTLPVLSRAQIPASLDGVTIGTTPEIPTPGETVVIGIESFATDLNSASIVWLVDGKNFDKGIGKKSIGLTAPAIGKNISILAVIMTVEGKEVKKALVLKSGGVDLIWESAGFVPPFYRGKALFAYENQMRVTAIPHLGGPGGTEIDPRTLVYKWKNNDKVILDQSGYGKQTVVIQEEIPRPLVIEVEVSTKNGSDKATSQITLNPGDPSVSFYEEDPLYGVLYNKALINQIRLTNQEINIRAVPYTFTTSKNSPLTYLWSINDLERTDLSTKESITLRTKGDVEGSSDISLEIRSVDNILQAAKNGTSILFSKKNTETNTTF